MAGFASEGPTGNHEHVPIIRLYKYDTLLVVVELLTLTILLINKKIKKRLKRACL
jgi:hypothetical protein